MEPTTLLLGTAFIVCAYMAWNIGANDVANAMGTSVGSGALTLRRAIIVAAVFEFTGAVFFGSHVTETIRKGVLDFGDAGFTEELSQKLMYGFMAALLAAAIWLTIATRFGMPVSTTHSIVGGVIGMGLYIQPSSVNWEKVIEIVLSWVASPLLGGILAFVSFFVIKRLIFNNEDPFVQTKKLAPILALPTFFVLGLAFQFKGLKGFYSNLDSAGYIDKSAWLPAKEGITFNPFIDGAWIPINSLAVALAIGMFASFILWVVLKRYQFKEEGMEGVERVFIWLQIITACYVAFAHGANDVANAIGPMAAIYDIATSTTGTLSDGNVGVPLFLLLIGGIDAKDNHIQVVATHRQLAKLALVNQFIERLTRSTQLKVVQLRLQPVEAAHKKLAFDVNNFTADESPSLNTISHILLCKDVTPLIGHLKVTHCEPFKPFPRAFINDKSDCWPIKVIMASASDRRNKVRYQMNIAAKISIGLFTQFDATLNDLSSSGLKLTLNNLTESTFDASPETVKISIKDINVVSQKYKIISYNPNTGILRLNLPKAEVRNKGQTIQGLVDSNAQYFDHRDLSIKQRNIHHFLWELIIRNLPSVCILVNFDRFSFNRLKTVYHQDNSIDLTPYTASNNTVSMQGFFVEDNATTAKSALLDKILCNNHRDVQVVLLVRNEEQHIIQVKE
jgi:PiT family inorganic phosphate transporter